MSFEPIQILLFILAFVPGYVFIHTLDYHLLKGEKTQFEKTIQVLLASTVIWVAIIITPILPPVSVIKKDILNLLINIIKSKNTGGKIVYDINEYIKKAIYLYVISCFYVFLVANITGVIRRIEVVDKLIMKITGRDRYRAVSLRFYTEQLGSTVVVTLKNGYRYAGVLCGTPDDVKDNAILIDCPKRIFENKYENNSAKQMLIYIDTVDKIEVIKQFNRRNLWQKRHQKKK